MNDEKTPTGMREYSALLRRRLGYILAIAPPFLLGSIFLAFWLTPRYRGTATIMLETSSVTKDVIGSTVVSYAGQQIEVVQGRVMTPEVLKGVIEKYDPYPGERTLSVVQKAQRVLENTTIERVDPVTFTPTTEDSNAFSLHYDNPDRARAVAVADRLSQLFLTYQKLSRAEAARNAAAFLQQQSEAINKEILGVDEELARFKSAQGDALPDLRDQNQAAMDRTERNLDTLQQEILAAEERESQLSVQLSQMSPNIITQTGDLTDLATVRAKLAEAQQRYTPDHPEVKRLKQALQMLMAQNPGGSAASGGIVAGANNPQYVLLATQLSSARRELASLRSQKAREQDKLNSYEVTLRRTPTVERSYSDIIRRRQSLQAEYQQIRDKLQNAQVAQSFESEQRGERFVMLRPPALPASPIYPNRVGFMSLGLLLGLGMAAAAVAIAESTDVNIRNVGDLPVNESVPLLATIPRIHNSLDLQQSRRLGAAVSLAFGVAIFLVGVVVVSRLRH
jgi:polysaccharide chain length determinant protein (PEP-CTERM system associated)